MADNFFGPASTDAVTTRPSLTPGVARAGSAVRWFTPCTSPGAGDGTRLTAEWGNVLNGNLEAVRAAAGITAAIATPGGDSVLLASILALISANGAIHVGAGGGSANVITSDVSPSVTAWVDGQVYLIEPAATSTSTTVTFSPDGLTAKTIVNRDGSALAVGDMVLGVKHLLIYDASLDKTILYSDSSADRNRHRTTVYDTAGTYTWTAPTSAWYWVEVYGAGGGGGRYSTSPYEGEGGAGGGYAGKWVRLAAGTTVTVTVGAAGVGSGVGSGTAGGTTSFGSHCSATGGGPGTAAGASGSGGAGSGGDINLSGQSGTNGTTAYQVYNGSGGDAAGPMGGHGAPGAGSDGATWPGGGGSISANDSVSVGGPAAAGGVIIRG